MEDATANRMVILCLLLGALLILSGVGTVSAQTGEIGRADSESVMGMSASGTVTVPGSIQAEDYDLGGEGVAYHDTTPGNSGGVYRQDDVDIAAITGGYAVTEIQDGEWLAFTIDGVTDAGSWYPYPVDLCVASDRDSRSVQVEVDGTIVRNQTVPNTGSLSIFTPVLTQFSLTQGGLPEGGRHTIRLIFHGDHQALDRIVFWPREVTLYSDGWSQPKFSANRTSGMAPLAVQFTDESSDYTYGWHWYVGNEWPAMFSTRQNPVYTFEYPGVWTVSLKTDEEDYWFKFTWDNRTAFGWFHHLYESKAATVQVNVTAPVTGIPGGSGVPRDLNGDGLYEDVTGNGALAFVDVILYFNQMDWIMANEPLAAFDYTRNGSIGFADIIWLFNQI